LICENKRKYKLIISQYKYILGRKKELTEIINDIKKLLDKYFFIVYSIRIKI